MNDAQQNASFGFSDCFGATWNSFKSNYGLCLGIGILIILISIAVFFVAYVVAAMFSSPEDLTSGIAVGIVLVFFGQVLILSPVATVLLFKIVSRLRGGGSPRAGWYARVLVVAFVGHLFFLPAMICSSLSNPSGLEQMKLVPQFISATVAAIQEQGAGPDVESPAQQRIQELSKEMEKFDANKSKALEIAGHVLNFLAFLLTICWMPWAGMAACDPNESTGAVDSLRRGWELAKGSAWGIIFSSIVLFIIAVASTFACCLPGILFGFPLLMAFSPGVYVLLRDGGQHKLPQPGHPSTA
jgi:hypothetical protein